MFMSGVDRKDHMLSYYPCEWKTFRWYKKVFIHITQQLLLNAYFLYCKNERKISFYEFRLAIIRALLQTSQKEPHPSFTASSNQNIHVPEFLPKVKSLLKLKEKDADIAVRLEIVKILLIFVQFVRKNLPYV